MSIISQKTLSHLKQDQFLQTLTTLKKWSKLTVDIIKQIDQYLESLCRQNVNILFYMHHHTWRQQILLHLSIHILSHTRYIVIKQTEHVINKVKLASCVQEIYHSCDFVQIIIKQKQILVQSSIRWKQVWAVLSKLSCLYKVTKYLLSLFLV